MERYKITILGCGSSTGVPSIEAGFGFCDPNNMKNIRSRTSAFLEIFDDNNLVNSILFDTSTDFRQQALDNNIKSIDAILYTHAHADHIYGLDDVRSINRLTRKEILCYASSKTASSIEKAYDYIFKNRIVDKHIIAPSDLINKPMIKMNIIEYNDEFKIRSCINNKDILIKTALQHHCKTETMGFVINDKIGYATDFHALSEYALKIYKNLSLLIVSATVVNSHPSHATFEEVLKIIEKLNPKKAIITHMSAEIDYEKHSKNLPNNVILAHDGLVISID